MGTNKDAKLRAGAAAIFSGQASSLVPKKPSAERIKGSFEGEVVAGRRGRRSAPSGIWEGHSQVLRTTCYRIDQYQKIREIARLEGRELKDINYLLIQEGIRKYELKHGEVQIPDPPKGDGSIF